MDKISLNNKAPNDELIDEENELTEGEDLSQNDEEIIEDEEMGDELDFDIDFDDELSLELEDDEVFDVEALNRRLLFVSPIVSYVRARMNEIANTSFYTSAEAKKALVEVADRYLKEMLDSLCAELVSIMFLNRRRTVDRAHVAYAMEHVFKLFINQLYDKNVVETRKKLISSIFNVQLEDQVKEEGDTTE